MLDVSADIDARFGGSFNDIRVEPAYVRLVPTPEGQRPAPWGRSTVRTIARS